MNTTTASVTLDSLKGRILDLDSHLQLPMGGLAPFFGDLAGEIGQARARRGMGRGQAALARNAGWERQEHPDEDNVWTVKGHNSYGANQPEERVRVMDLMGIERQLIFPMVAVARAAWQDSDAGREALRRYNDFVIGWAAHDPQRLRPTTILAMNDPAAALVEAERVVSAGSRAVLLPAHHAPAHRSPADADWDPLWAFLADSRVPALFHVGSQDGFISGEWTPSNLPATALAGNEDEPAGPFQHAVGHMSIQVYMSALILGGVLERHEHLVIGAIELGAQWVGPMADMLDQRAGTFARRMSSLLSMKPSEYLRRQFRATPYFFEPTARYIDQYGLEDVYAFSTDFPHPEGGTRPLPEMFDRIRPLGDEIIEKVFVTNAELIIPA